MAENSGKPDIKPGDNKNTGGNRGGSKPNQNSEKNKELGVKSNKGGNRRRNNRRRGNKPRGKRSFTTDTVYVCPVCGQNVRDVLTAISFGPEKVPAHFDCVVKDLSGKEELKNKEKIVYLGKGEFGVVKFKGNNGGKFEIIRRITLENDKEGPIPWRKDISKQLKR
ncbi:MAG: hypothetical protein JEY99_07530 [Spirochaetales bacterium]|nr:hypothetical protein [Spirochaetales bacterium]